MNKGHGRPYSGISMWTQRPCQGWKLNQVIHIFLQGLPKFKLKDGFEARFWEDTWVGSIPLKERFSILYNMILNHHTIMGQMTLDISSCRALTGKRLIDWHNLVAKIAHIHLSNEKYTFTWDYKVWSIFSMLHASIHVKSGCCFLILRLEILVKIKNIIVVPSTWSHINKG